MTECAAWSTRTTVGRRPQQSPVLYGLHVPRCHMFSTRQPRRPTAGPAAGAARCAKLRKSKGVATAELTSKRFRPTTTDTDPLHAHRTGPQPQPCPLGPRPLACHTPAALCPRPANALAGRRCVPPPSDSHVDKFEKIDHGRPPALPPHPLA